MALEFDSSPQLNSEEPSEVSARNVIEIDAPMTFPTVPAELRYFLCSLFEFLKGDLLLQ